VTVLFGRFIKKKDMKKIVFLVFSLFAFFAKAQNLPSVSTTATIEVNNNGTVGTATPAQIVAAGGGGGGTVSTVSVVTANGFSGTVANATTTPAITLTTSLTNGSIPKSNGTGFVAAVAGDFPVLNQSTTGTSANVTGIVAIGNGGTGSNTQNFVDLSTTQSAIAGAKTFTGGVISSGLTTASGGLTSSGQRILTTTTLSSATTLTASTANEKIIADATSAAFTITLPTTPTVGTKYTFVKKNVTTNSVTIAAGGANTIDGLTTLIIYTGRRLYILEFDGSDWNIKY
jgi:hypothetical protein